MCICALHKCSNNLPLSQELRLPHTFRWSRYFMYYQYDPTNTFWLLYFHAKLCFFPLISSSFIHVPYIMAGHVICLVSYRICTVKFFVFDLSLYVLWYVFEKPNGQKSSPCHYFLDNAENVENQVAELTDEWYEIKDE